MIKLFIFLILISSASFSCTICINQSPETKVQIYIDSTKDKIESAKFVWVLTKEFTQSLEEVYDSDMSGKFESNELELMELAFYDYASQNNFLTHISYDVVINKKESKKINLLNYKAYIKDEALHFEYNIALNYEIKKDYSLYIKVDDKNRFFLLYLDKSAIHFKNENKIQRLFNTQSVVFVINSKPRKEIVLEEEKKKDISTVITEQGLLKKFVTEVKKQLLLIQKGESTFALVTLLFISFLYGIIHALGPGHGKSLAFSYFSVKKSTILNAFVISQISAFIHILGAFVLVVISVFILKTFLNTLLTDSVLILTKVSAFMIVGLSLYILYKKINKKTCGCCANPASLVWKPNSANLNRLKPVVESKKNHRQDLYFIITAGLVPCPGTVVLFIYAFVLKTYFAVILASIFISFGMGLVIFISAFFGVKLRLFSQRSKVYTNILEYFSIVFMFTLGVLLYFNANVI